MWEVIGGRDKGGILVRSGKDLKSPQFAERLSFGAHLREIELSGDRLHYELRSGSGPPSGWVSLKLKDKDLVKFLAPDVASIPVRKDEVETSEPVTSKVTASTSPITVHVDFSYEGQKWSHEFELDGGSSILDLKKVMAVASPSEASWFELLRLGKPLDELALVQHGERLDFSYNGRPDWWDDEAARWENDKIAVEVKASAWRQAAKRTAAEEEAAQAAKRTAAEEEAKPKAVKKDGEAESRRQLPNENLTSEQVVEWVLAAVDDFETLMLPLEMQDDSTKIRTQYKKLSLQVHPDKNKHADAEAAFKKLFGAMQRLSDPMQRRLALRKARGKGRGDDVDAFGEEGWWTKSSVDAMEKAFREMEQKYEEMGVFEFQKALDKAKLGVDEQSLWITPEEAKDLLEKDLAIFLDSRDTADFKVSHISGAHSLPGHTPEQLLNIEFTDNYTRVVQNPEQDVIVYSDNGSRLSRCSFVAQALRSKLDRPNRVLRLSGGLNLWKRNGFVVEGDARALFAGKVLGDSLLRLGADNEALAAA